MDKKDIPYDSPINLYSMVKEMTDGINSVTTDHVWKCVLQIGVDIDKEKLMQAIKQDRKRYEEAYQKGYLKSQEEFEAFKKQTNIALNALMETKKCFPIKSDDDLFPIYPFKCSHCSNRLAAFNVYCSACGSEIIWPVDGEGEEK